MKSIFILLVSLCSFQLFAQVNSAKKYFVQSNASGVSFLYIRDISMENSLANEPKSVTITRFNAIAGVQKFTRVGNGLFKLIIPSNKVNDFLKNYFHFSEAEIAEKAKSKTHRI
jgi:hypothetical protein